jgi:tRNA (guanine-N7-)-methyltransferase
VRVRQHVKAWFLAGRAREQPGGFYVGVEIRRDLVNKANRDCAELGLHQVHSVFANMSVDLPLLFDEGRVQRFFLNFPDPFFKRQQHKRRALTPTLIDCLARLLTPDGEIHVNTDMFDHALDAMFLLESDKLRRFVNLRAPWSFLSESRFGARSRREQQCLREGTKIWRLAYGRSS